ncbi:MAG: diguanylate cyclase [Leptolyngbya sp.]|nr:diguanylate cyclase [Leptolyngbya sp.]
MGSTIAPAQERSATASILVVDDAPDNLRLLLNALQEEGYTVRCAKSGNLALVSSENAPPDLVLLDILMPNMDGYEVCQHLRQNLQTSEVPIIFLSALDEGNDKVKAFALGGNDYIAKPFSVEEVLARIRYQLQAKRRHQQLQVLANQYRHRSHDLEQARTLLMEVLDGLSDGIAAFQPQRDQTGRITDFQSQVVNQAFWDDFWPWFSQQQGTHPPQNREAPLQLEADSDLFDVLQAALEATAPLQREVYCHHTEADHWVEVLVTQYHSRLVTRLRDVTQTKAQITDLEVTKQELYRLAMTDGLTQIANRYCFDSYLKSEWARLQREQQPLALILGDIDQFKRYNDICGHLMGDRCLQAVAQAIRQILSRPADLVARYRGAAFAILLPATPHAGALIVADRLQQAIRNLRLEDTVYPICEQVRISLGVACMIPDPALEPQQLVAAADRALYQAKTAGGNCTHVDPV